jgi:hypothetical protein
MRREARLSGRRRVVVVPRPRHLFELKGPQGEPDDLPGQPTFRVVEELPVRREDGRRVVALVRGEVPESLRLEVEEEDVARGPGDAGEDDGPAVRGERGREGHVGLDRDSRHDAAAPGREDEELPAPLPPREGGDPVAVGGEGEVRPPGPARNWAEMYRKSSFSRGLPELHVFVERRAMSMSSLNVVSVATQSPDGRGRADLPRGRSQATRKRSPYPRLPTARSGGTDGGSAGT